MLDPDLARDLADRLRDAGYTYDGVAARLGPEGFDGLARNSTVPSEAALHGARDPQATLIRAFALQQVVEADALKAVLGPAAYAPELVELDGARARAAIELRPYDFEHAGGTHSGWLASDLTPTLDGRLARPRTDFVLGLSPASITLAQLTMRMPVDRALDLGAGCGVQALHLATHAAHVVATDLNPRACAMSQLTAALNDVQVDVRQGSLYEPVDADTFDLIVTNPPFHQGVAKDTADTLRIGRGTDCKLHLPDPRIALHHAAIYRAEDGSHYIEAEDGTVSVDGAFERAKKLASGQRIIVGPYELMVFAAPSTHDLGMTLELIDPLKEGVEEVKRQVTSGLSKTWLSKRLMSWTGLIVMLLTVTLSFLAGLGFLARHDGVAIDDLQNLDDILANVPGIGFTWLISIFASGEHTPNSKKRPPFLMY